MFDHISLLALIAWVFAAFVEHCIAKAGGLTIIGHLFAKLGADLRPGRRNRRFRCCFYRLVSLRLVGLLGCCCRHVHSANCFCKPVQVFL